MGKVWHDCFWGKTRRAMADRMSAFIPVVKLSEERQWPWGFAPRHLSSFWLRLTSLFPLSFCWLQEITNYDWWFMPGSAGCSWWCRMFSLYGNAAAGVCEAIKSIKDHLHGQAGRPGRGGNLSPPAAISDDWHCLLYQQFTVTWNSPVLTFIHI